MSNEIKEIKILGQNNRYQMKKVTGLNEGKSIKKTNVSATWKFNKKYLKSEEQTILIKDLSNSEVDKVIKKQINSKIYSYKQQDMKKKNYDENSEIYKDFIDFDIIIEEMNKCDLKCHYCRKYMLILYENVRDNSQWTVDRINNDIGHIKGNFNLVCLKCNLKRRRQNHEKYLFTCQLSINKLENNYIS
jgi:hypothetical protein